MVTQVFRRSGRCVVRTFSVVRVAARRTVQVIAHPGLTLRHTQRAPPSSPRIQNSRSLPVSPRTPKYSPNSPARRVYIRQASYFRENKHCPERLEDVLSAQEGGSRRKEMMHYSEEEAAYEPIIIHEEIGDLSPPFWVTALSALLTAICIFYSFLIMDAHLGSFRLGRFFEIVFVALLGICMATSILILFAPYSLGLHRGPLDVLLDMLGVPVPRDSVDFFAQSNQEEEFVQQELGNNNQQKDSSPENNQQRSEDDDDGIVCTQNLQPPISPKASGAQLASEEESMTARNAVLRCRALINEGDECDLDDPFLHVISMELNNLNPKAAYQAFWAGPQGGEFYANFLNTCAKNKNAQADEWQSKNDHEIRSMTTLHPLATNIRFPGLNLVIPTSKSQRAFHDLEEPTCLALFERSKFGGIPFGDALRVETVWIFENVQRITSKDIPVNKSHQEEIQENVLDTKGAQEDAILPPALDNIISTKVRIYFRCLFIDKVFPIPRWVKRTAIGKTKIELATTYGKWRDHVMGIVHSPSIAIEKRLLVNSDSMPIESTTFSDKEVLGTAPPALAESKSDDRPRSVRNDNTKHGRRHRSQQPKIDIFNSTQKKSNQNKAT
uniref:VASt domain-containing protein n=1 Tax=Aureoumbra lagunensis TaxID=44058 RepID=A0A7S3JT93_9STRA|mmetsp:Transcript_2884/g.4015  ORF Transcript_2884/g.4015 Transcript_2884/m.4015 type:complete len:611 (-) Transcript_2884:994-2826(-)